MFSPRPNRRRFIPALAIFVLGAWAQETDPGSASPADDAVYQRCMQRLEEMRGLWTAEWELQEDPTPVDTPRTARAAATQMTLSDDPMIRQRALEALTLRGGAATLKEYLWALGDPVGEIRETASQALNAVPASTLLEQILDVLVENVEEDVRALDAALPALNSDMSDEFLRLFRDDSLTVPIRRAAAYSLGKMRVKRALPDLAAAVNAQEPGLAMSAALAIYSLRDTRAVPTWISLRGHPDFGIRWLAVQALAELSGREAYAALEETALGGENNDAKLVSAAIDALATWPLVDSVPALIGVMRKNPGYRQRVATLLTQRTGQVLGDRADAWEDWYVNGPAPPPDDSAGPPKEDAPSDLLRHAQFVPPELRGQTF